MSQAKVDRYKKQKANRKQTMRRDKMKRAVRRVCVCIVALVLVGWLGYSAHNMYEASRPKETAVVDYSAVTEYQSDLSTNAAE